MVRNVRILPHLPTDAMTAVFPHQTEAFTGRVILDRMPDSMKPGTCACLLDSKIEGALGCIQQMSGGITYSADTVRPRGIAAIPADSRSHINGDNVSIAKHSTPGDAMNDLFVDR